jgi:NADH pyrophosphatase NudC (nudix superfamily)
MPEYIEREALISRLNKVCVTDDVFGMGMQTGIEHTINCTKEAPTADVVEVRHAKWVERKEIFSDYEGEVEAIGCSECGKSQRHYQKTNYCPNCGAKMDKEKDDIE